MGRTFVGDFAALNHARLRTLPILLCGAVLCSAQWKRADAPADQPTFSVKVNLVRVLASVKDASGTPITNLNEDDFEISDSNVQQKISVFERNTSLPLSVAVLIDTSGSTAIDLHYETDSVLRFLPTLLNAGNIQDAFALFSFNWRTNMESDYSRSLKRAERSLKGLRGEGGTSMYDAIYLASETLTGREGRHVIVIVTDGGDTTSYKKFEDALQAVQEADAILFPIVVVPIENDAGRNIGGEHALTTLASATGGRIFYPGSFERLDTAFTQILKELRTQYLIGFYPRGVLEQAHLYHPLSVKVRPTRLRVTARSGYFQP
jgi:Ca-activated chloride channel family protein